MVLKRGVKPLLLVGLSFFCASNAKPQNIYSYYMLEKELKVISATKEYVTYTSVPRYMRVITREELDKWGVRNLFDLLKKIPEFYVRKSGFYLNAVGALGLRQSYFSEKIQVLIDGIPLTDPSTGSSFSTNNNISLDNVKRVEIVYGPMTSLYGFNASLAVINLITYDADDVNLKFGSHVNTDGSNDSYFIKSISTTHWKGILSLNYNEEKGHYDDYTDAYGLYTADVSSYSKHSTYYLKLNHDSGLYLKSYGIDRDTTFPSSVGGLITKGNNTFTDRRTYLNRLGIKQNFNGTKIDVSVFFNWFYLKRGYNICPSQYFFCKAVSPSGLLATEKRYVKSYGSSLEASFEALKGKVTTGVEVSKVDMYKTKMDANFLPSTSYAAFATENPSALVTRPYGKLSENDKILGEAKRTVVSPYLQYFFSDENYSLLANLRWDKANDVGNTFSYSLSGMFKATERLSLKLNLGKSVRIPSFEEMHIRNNPVLQGNDDLDFEKVYAFMPSAEYTGDDFKASGMFYYFLIKDTIYKRISNIIKNRVVLKWDNSSKDVKVKGFTLSLRKNLWEGELYGSVGRKISFEGPKGTACSKFPKWKGVFGYSLMYPNLTLDINTEAYSKVDKAPGYYVVNLALSTNLTEKVRITARIDNLFDRDIFYPTTFFGAIKGEGRNLWVGLDVSF